MGILIGRYEFEGPFSRLETIREDAGMYAIISYHEGNIELLDLDHTDNLLSAIEEHVSYDYWTRHSPGIVSVIVHYLPRMSLTRRQEVVDELLLEFDGTFEAACLTSA